jgi:hypothetical protein
MSKAYHPSRDRLMDFVDGELDEAGVGEIRAHLAGCETCRAYVESLKLTLRALEVETVPEPPEAYFAFLAGRARQRAGSGRTRLVFKLAPGLAAAAVVVALMWRITGTPVAPVDSVDIIMAEMTTGEIVETLAADPYVGSLLIGDSEADLDEIDSYLKETESVYGLLDAMSEAERARFMAYLKGSMVDDDEISGPATGSSRKGC